MTTKETTKRNLFQKLYNVMGLVGNVPKSGYNEVQRYKFVTEADVMDKVREAAILEGVLIMSSVVGHTIEHGMSGNSKPYILTTVTIELTAIDIDNPSDRYTWQMIGQGTDPQDKGSNKAITGAVKYGLLKPFLVGTGDDAEHEKDTHDYPPAQAKTVTTYAQATARQERGAPIKGGHDSPPPNMGEGYSDDDTPAFMLDADSGPAPAKLGETFKYNPPYPRKDEIKALGARWNKDSKTWDSTRRLPEFESFLAGVKQ